MCGITALSRSQNGSSIPDAREWMRHALHAIESRGADATGAAWHDPAGEVWYWKEPGAATQVSGHCPFPTGLQTAIGHTRYATKGNPKLDTNNHPVIGAGIALVHNGRVDNDDEIFRTTGAERMGEVDSEALVALLTSLDQFGAAHPVEVLELVEGVAAIAWLTAEDPHVLHLARASTRPMCIGYTRRGDLLMSSTKLTLLQTAVRSKVGVRDIEELKEGTYLRVESGKVVDRRRFKPLAPRRSAPADVPNARPRSTTHPATTAHKRTERVLIDGIDWSNLAPRRGWK